MIDIRKLNKWYFRFLFRLLNEKTKFKILTKWFGLTDRAAQYWLTGDC